MKILIIKLGALGDVVRTLSILQGIKENYPDSDISWVTKNNAIDIFEGNPYVKNIFTIPYKTEEEFDILYNFDIEKEATELAIKIKANKKYGFYSEGGYPAAFNLGAEYYLSTIFDDELKKNNKKTYQEMKEELFVDSLMYRMLNQNVVSENYDEFFSYLVDGTIPQDTAEPLLMKKYPEAYKLYSRMKERVESSL